MDDNVIAVVSDAGAPKSEVFAVIAELDGTIARSSVRRCDEILMHVTDLFVAGASRFSEEEICLFDDILCRLALAVDVSARTMLARRLAPIANAPLRTCRLLGNDDEVTVATPLLAQSQKLDDDALLQFARTKGQEHLCVIARREPLTEPVTDVLVDRGNSDVLHAVANNSYAKFSELALDRLVSRCAGDDELATIVGTRPDLPFPLFQSLLSSASELVRSKFLASNLPVMAQFSCAEPHFVFIDNGRTVLAA